MMSLTNMVRGTITNDAAEALLRNWEHDVGTLQFWRASSNFVYLFRHHGETYYLRFVHEEDQQFANITAELDFMNYLYNNGYPTVTPISSMNDQLIETISTETGRYFGVVFTEASGNQPDLEEMTDDEIAQWGQSLARLHLLSENYDYSSYRSWSDALDFVATVLQRYPNEHEAHLELQQLRTALAQLPEGVASQGIIHYDFETDNVFYNAATSTFCAIDFDDAMVHWYVMDIAAAISDLLEEENDEAKAKVECFISGYRSIRRLEEAEVSLIPLFQRFAELYSFARLLRSVEDMDISAYPLWAIDLRNRLLHYCEENREIWRTSIK
ncbi:phosphotransferase enzyme family protein [Paenibacillus sp. L3-i20]|uniref:phosphotransferase enzyme family protein n=1 Tax=Paenibacillus sp. L3-i20 TaxID=2905833 RepID=UPI001EDF978F|nr:phosphotransferase [Paenibacillus sp. L3-i20]GKU78122.1 hypothetical protein L3i20_v225190 [Paenibacillus sp. L3-i20]